MACHVIVRGKRVPISSNRNGQALEPSTGHPREIAVMTLASWHPSSEMRADGAPF